MKKTLKKLSNSCTPSIGVVMTDIFPHREPLWARWRGTPYCKVFLWLLLFLPAISINSQAEVGTASFYGAGEKLNKHTANGDVFYPSHLTAASYQYYKKYVRVKSLRTGKEITVFVNDLGPAKRLNRLIDLSREAFRLLEGSLDAGLTNVSVEVLS